MKFAVTPQFVKGQHAAMSAVKPPSVTGQINFEVVKSDGQGIEYANVTDDYAKKVLPELLYPQVIHVSRFGMRIRGYERLRTNRGDFDVRQEWLCEFV